MNIKTFKAASLREGLERVREEFGESAKILHAREVDRRRLFGLWKSRSVEITAAENDVILPGRGNDGVEEEREAGEDGRFSEDEFLERLVNASGTVLQDFPVQRFTEKQNAKSDRGAVVPSGHWRRMTFEQLNPSVLQRGLIARFQQIARFAGPIDLSGQRRIVAFLGTTGVGKTSMIAKIAAHYKIKEFKKVGLLTMDLFRIAATEQLRKYAEMLDIPLETASNPDRIAVALRRLEDCDLVLFDTPGTSPKNAAKLQMLASGLDAARPDEVLLLLSATSSLPVLNDTVRRFEPLGSTGLILTKLDETVGLVELYQFLKTNSLPLRFFSMGRNISEDIEVAGPARLASFV